jgi:hypothetical protein
MSTEVSTYNGRREFNSRLVLWARNSFSSTAERLGVTELEVAQMYADLFGNNDDWLTLRLEERLLLIELSELKELIMDKLRYAEEENFASIANAAVKTLTLLSTRLDERKKLIDEDINKITIEQAKTFGRGFDIAMQHMIAGLRILHPEITDEEVKMLKIEGLMKAKTVIEQETSQ